MSDDTVIDQQQPAQVFPIPQVDHVSGSPAHLGVLFKKVDGVEIVAIYHAKRAGTLNYVHLTEISSSGRSDVFMLSMRDPERPALGTCTMEQQRAALYLRAALEYAQHEEHACTPEEQRLIEGVSPSIPLLEAGTHP
jgi:hypothetical protein